MPVRTISTHVRNDTYTSQMTLSPTNSIPLPPAPINCIPIEHHHRTLVLCFDGTGDKFDGDNSNVVEFFSMLKKDDPTQQVVYYQPGIGTYVGRHGSKGKVSTAVAQLWDKIVAWNLSDHVKEGYNFLMQNYVNGDKISIFGFSRGAYTARALAGMLHKVGLLTPGNEEQIPFAYNMFARTDKKSWKQATEFKDAFAIDVKVDFVGVWDTVRSVGILDKSLPFTTSSNHIRHFRHAIALDEHRTKFQANHWNPPTEQEASLGSQYEGDNNTDVKEVWFTGVHTDVGGGSVLNGIPHSLAKIPLRWMIQECFRCRADIMFDTKKLFAKTGLTDYHLIGSTLEPRIHKDPEDFKDRSEKMLPSKDRQVYEREKIDLTQRTHDQLACTPYWWILEYLPLRRSLPSRFKTDDAPLNPLSKFIREHPINMGRGRKIPRYDAEGVKHPVYVHHTVYERMSEKEYTPRARNWEELFSSITWTD